MTSVQDFEINPYEWFSERKLAFTPKHFTVAATPISNESTDWIVNNLKGRYSFVDIKHDDWIHAHDLFVLNMVPAFEDPQEAVFYELTWSS